MIRSLDQHGVSSAVAKKQNGLSLQNSMVEDVKNMFGCARRAGRAPARAGLISMAFSLALAVCLRQEGRSQETKPSPSPTKPSVARAKTAAAAQKSTALRKLRD